MGQYSISEIESLSGIKAHTLRMWELRYGFLKPQRTDTNIRFYDDEQLKLVLNISTLARNGMKISKIAQLEQMEMQNEVQKLCKECCEPNAIMAAFLQSMMDLDEARFEKNFSCAITKHGFEKTFAEFIFPLLVRAGTLWSTGAIHPVQEHFISNLIRRKIHVAIDAHYVEKNTNTRKFVLFLPEGESHELLLLFSEYVLRQRHHEVVYIGNSVPFKELQYVIEKINPDGLLCYISMPTIEMPVQDYIAELAATFPSQSVILGGKQALMHQASKPPGNVTFISGYSDLISALA